ncbi:hypothetical protein Q8F55_003658 [Vanrija albida]|uniref:RRM domain-containing protein n=1 Tax=Vanrija albida TaxID=181172 RepID=A0ABR3Q4X2_9TREE
MSLAGPTVDRAGQGGAPDPTGPPSRVGNLQVDQAATDGAGFPPNSLGGPTRQPPTSAEIDAVIAAAMANAPPAPPPIDIGLEGESPAAAILSMHSNRIASVRSLTPLMTNILPSAIGSDGRVNLFVGNLPYRVRWQDLKDLFRKAGTVLRADVSLGPDNRSRGYGNVLMGSREDAARAIDRFNGFMWQTRTLEVRPDRLPPEYEPQPHVHHKPMFGFMPPPMHNFAGGGGGGGWPPRPPPQGPPFGGGPFPPHLGPASSHSGGPGHPQAFGRSSALANHAPPAIPPIGASPLAGSLTSGTSAATGAPGAPGNVPGLANLGGGPGGPNWSHSGRDTLAPFGALPVTDQSQLPLPRSKSPGSLATSRLALDRPPSPGNANDDALGRAPGANRIGPPFAGGVKNALSPEVGTAPLRRLSGGQDAAPTLPIAPPTIALNGLAGQAKDLGAPATLVDRVVFVKNLSLATQWQDLKDLFRPAGVVIRADVATGPDGQARGFGTVLFASKDDALNAVSMFNNHEVDGRVLHVQTERQTLEDKQIQPIHPIEPFPSFKASSSVWTQPPPAPLNTAEPFVVGGASPASSGPSPSNARVPWQLNTAGVGEGGPPSARREMPDDLRNARHVRHPGPINLPPFPAVNEMNVLSPLQTRNLPPMTPSMPGFVFNAYPRTPPVHPQFLSAGMGPFSPGAPVTSPMYNARNPFLNPAPGAPVHRTPQHPQGPQGSAALGTPTTQAFPQNTAHGGAGPPGGRVGEDEYFPRVASPPLDARKRLSPSLEEDLAKHTTALSLDPVAETTNSSPTPKGTTPPANGRSSFDNAARQQLAVGSGPWNSDRRASWSEVAGANGH